MAVDLNTVAGDGPSEAPESNPESEPTVHARRLVLMGQGYVGLPVAMQAVARGYSVVGFDVDEAQYRRPGTRLAMFSEAIVAEQLRGKALDITLRFSPGNTTVNMKAT